VALARDQLLPFASRYQLAVHAYCFMPDHVHVLVAGTSEAARLRPFVAAWKQHTGYEFARAFTARLWQPGYFERVLREEETNEVVARYVVGNPLRAGMAARIGEYPYSWCA
jgi:putative transposase